MIKVIMVIMNCAGVYCEPQILIYDTPLDVCLTIRKDLEEGEQTKVVCYPQGWRL